MKPKPLKISNVTLGGKEPAFILGPCVIESEKFVRRMAQRIAEICAAESVQFIFKASYDKANRTSVRSYPRHRSEGRMRVAGVDRARTEGAGHD